MVNNISKLPKASNYVSQLNEYNDELNSNNPVFSLLSIMMIKMMIQVQNQMLNEK